MSDDFEDFLIAQNDKLEQTAYALLWRMTHPRTDISEMNEIWTDFDMAQIGPLLADAEGILLQSGFPVCHPYFGESETPCFLVGDCKFSPCPMRNYIPNGGK